MGGGVGAIGVEGEEADGGSLIFSRDLDSLKVGSEGEWLMVDGSGKLDVDVDKEREIEMADEIEMAGETSRLGVADPILSEWEGSALAGLLSGLNACLLWVH